MAPYLDPPAPRSGTSAASSSSLYEDESFVLPALIKFGGETVVTEEGQLVYVFPSLQRSGTGVRHSTCCSVFEGGGGGGGGLWRWVVSTCLLSMHQVVILRLLCMPSGSVCRPFVVPSAYGE